MLPTTRRPRGFELVLAYQLHQADRTVLVVSAAECLGVTCEDLGVGAAGAGIGW